MPAMVPGQEDAAADLHARLAGRPDGGSASSLRRCRRVTARPRPFSLPWYGRPPGTQRR